jgi:hypothetical protein
VRTYGACGAFASSWTEVAQKWKYTYTTCGFSEKTPSLFFETTHKRKIPSFRSLVKTPPDHIIISLGTNYVSEKSSLMMTLDVSDLFDQIIKYAPKSKCFWVGPPDSRKYHQKIMKINRIIKSFISFECTYFDSFNQTSYPAHGGDGVHFYGNDLIENEASKWAKKVYQSYINWAD